MVCLSNKLGIVKLGKKRDEGLERGELFHASFSIVVRYKMGDIPYAQWLIELWEDKNPLQLADSLVAE
jgi:hypothetical protein